MIIIYTFFLILGCAIVLLCLNLSMIAILLYSRYKNNRYLKAIWKISPYIAWLISVAQIGSFYFDSTRRVNPLWVHHRMMQLIVDYIFFFPREVLSWGIFINFQIYITLPIPLLWEGVALGLLNGVVFTTFNLVMCQEMKSVYRTLVSFKLDLIRGKWRTPIIAIILRLFYY